MHVGEQRDSSRVPIEAFDQAPAGVLVTRGEHHRLLYTNDAFQAMFGDRPVGVPVREGLRDVLEQDTLAALDEVWKTGETVRLDEVSVTVGCDDPLERLFRMSLSGIPLQGGESGLLAVVQEVTAQVAAARRVTAMEKELRRLRRRYQSIVWAGVHGVWVTGPHGESRESHGWQRLTGQTQEESLGRGWMRALHPEDRAHAEEWWDKAAEQAVSLYEVIYRVRTRAGVYRHIRFRSVPVRENRAVVEWVGTSTDVEQEWQEERRRRLLDRAAAAASDITNLEEMCQALADVVVPELADLCDIYLLPESSSGLPHATIVTERVASAVRGELPRLPTRRKECHPAGGALARAVSRRRPVQLTYPPGRPSFDCPEAVRTWMAETGSHSLAFLPVVVEGEVAAVVTTGACGDRPPIDSDDVRLIREIFDHTHDAMSKALRFRRTQRVALALQHSLLAELPHVPGLELAARYQASPTAAEIGGDWYDAFVVPCGAVKLVIGDVAGHDLAAAVCMSQVRNMLRALAVDRDESPGDVLRRLNTAMETLNGESTATCVLTRLERDGEGVWRLKYSVAGHPPPLLVTAEGEGRFLQDADNPLLGLRHDQPWISSVRPLPPHSTLLLYTDGLVERRGEDLGEGLERLRRSAEPLACEPLGRFCDELLTGMPVAGEDDVAMIAVRVPPEGRHEGVAS
ncbi:SpoIIE family protein phosphatase [Microbispora bryophytorum]|uniref:SpoIIE family protein phosphatase n=1 Tax=Microbispora bryophytorum TaxID=1460882 RepID=UPI0033E570C5